MPQKPHPKVGHATTDGRRSGMGLLEIFIYAYNMPSPISDFEKVKAL